MDGLEKTLAVLTETPNEAAVDVLLDAVTEGAPEIQQRALRAVLGRRNSEGQKELLRRWERLPEDWKQLIAEHPRKIALAVRDAVLGLDPVICGYGCDAVLRMREYDLIPAFITAAEEESNPNRDLAAQTLLSLAQLLYEEVAAPRDYKKRRDPQLVRQHVVASLGQSVERFDRHRRSEILEAFLLLARSDNPLLHRILSEPRHPAYLAIIELLTKCPKPGILRLVLSFLDSPDAPYAALNVLSHRTDLAFVRQLLKRIGDTPSEAARANLRRVELIRWIRNKMDLVQELDEHEQGVAVQLAVASGAKRLEVFEFLRLVMGDGNVGGRRAACRALAEFGGSEANDLVREALADPDPQVVANAAAQLRERGIPGAISHLIQLLDSPHSVVAEAAREGLAEFSFPGFLAVFDTLDEDVRRTTGELVMKVDREAVNELAQELKAKTRTRRLRGLEMATAMQAISNVEPLVIGLLGDEDHFLRAEAARALGQSESKLARQALREALLDRSVAVQEAAEHALRELARAAHEGEPPPAAPPLWDNPSQLPWDDRDPVHE